MRVLRLKAVLYFILSECGLEKLAKNFLIVMYNHLNERSKVI